jgi:enterochelin esterase-like enzyme
MQKFLITAFAILFANIAYTQYTDLPKPSAGKIERINLPSQYIDTRAVDIWLPENYPSGGKYNVIYMHDGQMLFDAAVTWNNQEWQVDETVSELMKNNKIQNTIVVGIHNNGTKRLSEKLPQKPMNYLPDDLRKKVDSVVVHGYLADDYLKFIVEELKPYIDKNFEVYTDPAHTFTMGASAGGLISWYAICEYPNVFGGAACFSTHWPGIVDNQKMPLAFLAYLKDNLPSPTTHKIYFATGDQELDARYPPHQQEVDKLMQSLGFNSKSWITDYFWGDGHNEKAWSKQLEKALMFLLGK